MQKWIGTKTLHLICNAQVNWCKDFLLICNVQVISARLRSSSAMYKLIGATFASHLQSISWLVQEFVSHLQCISFSSAMYKLNAMYKLLICNVQAEWCKDFALHLLYTNWLVQRHFISSAIYKSIGARFCFSSAM